MEESQIYIAFLRGINVGGHHKVPMSELKTVLKEIKCENVVTILNSGNIIFQRQQEDPEALERLIAEKLEATFGFPVPTIIRTEETILKLHERNPFKGIELTPDIRLYISFLKHKTTVKLPLSSSGEDGAFRIVELNDQSILSVLDISVTQTPKAMEALAKSFGKDITTRNWKTIVRIVSKLQ